MLTNSTSNVTESAGASFSGILNGICVFSAFTVAVNSIILIASKYTTAGKSATLVFMRSLCIVDLLIGVYGIFKTLLLKNLQARLINCFLPESIFVSATTTLCLTLLWLNADSYLRLTRPFGYGHSMDKGSVIIAMMMVWNGGFITGFLPQLGWNNNEYECNFFKFYSTHYILIVSLIWITCIAGGFVFQFHLGKKLHRIGQDLEFISSKSMEYKVYCQLVKTIRNDMIFLVLCYLPYLIYIGFYFIRSQSEDTEHASINLIYFIPVFLFRSFTSAFVHTYQTIKIQRMTPEGSRTIVRTLCKSFSSSSSDEQPTIYCSRGSSLYNDKSNKNSPIDRTPHKKHQPLCATSSNSTITTDLELGSTSNTLSGSVCKQFHMTSAETDIYLGTNELFSGSGDDTAVNVHPTTVIPTTYL